MSGHLQGVQLQHVAIVNAPLDSMNLSGASLREAFFDTSGFDFICERCDLAYADFRYFRLSRGAVLTLSNVDGMKLAYDPRYGIKMDGVNWWRATTVDPNSKTKQVQMNLEAQYPKAVAEQMRSRLNLPK
jgi:uncharacterized protein YjbI with pentapeptide repeats